MLRTISNWQAAGSLRYTLAIMIPSGGKIYEASRCQLGLEVRRRLLVGELRLMQQQQ